MQEPRSLADLCRALGRGEKDGTVRRVLSGLRTGGLLDVEKGGYGKQGREPDVWWVTEAGKAAVEGGATDEAPRGSGTLAPPPTEGRQTRMGTGIEGGAIGGAVGGSHCKCHPPPSRLPGETVCRYCGGAS